MKSEKPEDAYKETLRAGKKPGSAEELATLFAALQFGDEVLKLDEEAQKLLDENKSISIVALAKADYVIELRIYLKDDEYRHELNVTSSIDELMFALLSEEGLTDLDIETYPLSVRLHWSLGRLGIKNLMETVPRLEEIAASKISKKSLAELREILLREDLVE